MTVALHMTTRRLLQAQAVRVIAASYTRMMEEEEGALRVDDIEHLHRMRVASRRLRARLEDFAIILSTRKHARIRKQVRQITKRLGPARDMDVLGDFLRRELSTRKGRRPGNRPPLPSVSPQLLGAVRLKMGTLREELRLYFQKLHGSNAMRRMDRALGRPPAERLPDGCSLDLAVFSHRILRPRLRAVEAYRRKRFQGVKGQSDIHRLRIRVKKLRYSMEIFDPFYNDGFKSLIKQVKRLQDAAGRVHDYETHAEQIRELEQEGLVKSEDCEPVIRYCEDRCRAAISSFREDWKEFWKVNWEIEMYSYWASNTSQIAG